jgi:hypothetical protein
MSTKCLQNVYKKIKFRLEEILTKVEAQVNSVSVDDVDYIVDT